MEEYTDKIPNRVYNALMNNWDSKPFPIDKEITLENIGKHFQEVQNFKGLGKKGLYFLKDLMRKYNIKHTHSWIAPDNCLKIYNGKK